MMLRSHAATVTNTGALVVPPSTGEPQELKDIRPPVIINNPWFWLWLSIALLIAFIMGRWAWRKWLHHRTTVIDQAPSIPPHIRARERLQAAHRLMQDPILYCNEVSNILRTYLDERFDTHASECTTEEFLNAMRESSHLRQHQKSVLNEFLSLCDLAKFAKHEPSLPELERLHLVANDLVDETEPSAPIKAEELDPPPSIQT